MSGGAAGSTEARPLRADALRVRRRVVAAAQRLLLEQPQASMSAVAEAAQVGRSTVFRHFPHRDDLVRAAWIDAAANAGEEIRGVDLNGLDPGAAVDRLIEATVAVAERYPLLVRGARPPVDDPELVTRLGATEAAILAVVRRAVDAGRLRSDLPVTLLAEHLFGCSQAVVLAGLRGEEAQRAARSLFGSGAAP